MKKIASLLLALVILVSASANAAPVLNNINDPAKAYATAQVYDPAQAYAPSRQYYELRTYLLKSAEQEKMIDDYLRDALLPALKRSGIQTIGVFKPISNDTASIKKIMVLVPYKNMEQALKMESKLGKDKDYLEKGKAYIDAVYNNAPYQRMERIFMKAFSDQPVLKLPKLKSPKSDRVYELRSYESATEKIYWNKVQMFNKGNEINLFERLNFNGIFYGEVIFGDKMPNLVYMTSFENMDDRNAHWKSFGDDAEWKTLSKMPEYQNNVSHIDITYLRATEYSDL
ncbi:MAG: NIPSNAP family protein [Flavitalea sp.]